MTTTINLKVNMETKKRFEDFANSVGLSMSSLINIFISKTLQEQSIPFSIGLTSKQKERILRSMWFVKYEGSLSNMTKRIGFENEHDVDEWLTKTRRKESVGNK